MSAGGGMFARLAQRALAASNVPRPVLDPLIVAAEPEPQPAGSPPVNTPRQDPVTAHRMPSRQSITQAEHLPLLASDPVPSRDSSGVATKPRTPAPSREPPPATVVDKATHPARAVEPHEQPPMAPRAVERASMRMPEPTRDPVRTEPALPLPRSHQAFEPPIRLREPSRQQDEDSRGADQESTLIEVCIDRIELQQAPPPRTAAPAVPRQPASHVSLHDYLSGQRRR